MKSAMHWFMTVSFLLFLFGFSFAFWLLPDLDFSEQENRSLRNFPSFSWDSLFSGRFSAQINDYFADQFPLRDQLVGLKGFSEIALGKGANNEILLGRGGTLARYLFEVEANDPQNRALTDHIPLDTLQRAADGINRVANVLDVPFHVFLTGRNIDVATSSFNYPCDESDKTLAFFRKNLDSKAGYLDLIPMFRAKQAEGEQLYYRTDHHWTTAGAYLAYTEILRAFDMEAEIVAESCFSREVASRSFYGTLWSASGMKSVHPDTLEIWSYAREPEFVITADGRELDGFYNRDYLKRKDQYSVFLDGTHDVVTVRLRSGEERPVLLLIKDSFANSLAPFLALHFDLVLLNLSSARTDYTNVSFYASQYAADRVLLLYSLENVITAGRLGSLR